MDTKTQHITWRQIYRKPESLILPFRLELDHDGGIVLCKKLLRLLPKKRMTFLGEWEGKAVIIKLFIEPGRATRHIERERAGLQALMETGTPTPTLLHDGRTRRYRIPLIITDYLSGCHDLLYIWQSRKNVDDLASLMETITLELATQHVQGILQRDLHFGNLLVDHSNRIYTLDGSGIDFFDQPLPMRQSLDHLALFFSQLGVGTHPLQEHLLATYTTARAWRLKKSDLRFLWRMTRHYLSQRMENVRNKSLRNNSLSRKWTRLTSNIHYLIQNESPEFLALLKAPDYVFQAPNAVFLKKGRTATLVRAEINNRPLVIKRYNIKNISHALRRCLRPSRALHCWQHARALETAGIATAKPLACIEKRFLGLTSTAWLLMEYIEGETLADFFAHYTRNDPVYICVAERVKTLLLNLSELGFSHGDLKATNIIIRNGEPVLIDLDGMKKKHTPTRDLQRFMKNWVDRPEVAELFRGLLSLSPIRFVADR